MNLHSSQIYLKSCQLLGKFRRHKMKYPMLIFLCIGIVCFFLVPFVLSKYVKADDYMISSKETKSWDYLRFTQQWPPSVCMDPKSQHCKIPNNTNFWTIHGIWPDKFNTSQSPTNCNNSWHFNETDVMSIEDKLKYLWPDLLDGKASKTLWSHEWEKHGTCAASLAELNTILKYFTEGLQLRDQYNMLTSLSQVGIHPDYNKTLTLDSIKKGISDVLGKGARIQCASKKPSNNTLVKVLEGHGTSELQKSLPLLSVIEICLTKSFQLFECPDSKSSNCPLKGIIYLPFPQDKQNVLSTLALN